MNLVGSSSGQSGVHWLAQAHCLPEGLPKHWQLGGPEALHTQPDHGPLWAHSRWPPAQTWALGALPLLLPLSP